MIEVKIPGLADGRGYIKLGPTTTTFKTGAFVKLATSWGTEAPGTPGKAYNGAICYIPAVSGDTMASGFAYPYNKLIYKPEDNETSSDYAVSGDGIIVYKSGQYETDQYNTTDTLTGLTPGTLLYLDASSVLSTGAGGVKTQIPRAKYIGMNSSYSSKQSARAMLWFELLDQVYLTSGMLGF